MIVNVHDRRSSYRTLFDVVVVVVVAASTGTGIIGMPPAHMGGRSWAGGQYGDGGPACQDASSTRTSRHAPATRDGPSGVEMGDGAAGSSPPPAPMTTTARGGGGDDGVSPPPSATTATSSSSAPTSSTSPSSSSNSAWTGEYASSHAKNLRVPPHPPNCILLLAHTPWRRRKQCLRYIVVVVAAAAAAEHRKSIKYTQPRADLGRPNAMTGLTGRGGERGLLIFTSLTDDIIFEMRCGRARENYSSSEALLSLRNLKNTNSYDELLDRRPDRKTRVLRSKKADFQAGTHVGTHVRTLRHLPT